MQTNQTALFVRANTSSSSEFETTVIQYAELPNTTIRFGISKKYVHESELPYKNSALIHNSPLLLAIATFELPSVSSPIHVVIDYPGLTMQRDNRASEVHDFIDRLISQSKAKIYFSVQAVPVTFELTPEAAATEILSADFTELTPLNVSDFLRRLI